MENEFEDIADDFLEEDTETAPSSIDEDVPTEDPETSNNMISTGNRGTAYDWNSAPDQVRAPERIDLDGQTVTIKKADIIIPSQNEAWKKPFKGKNVYKSCKFILYYDVESQQEFYSGIKVFKTDDGKYSHPSIPKNKEGRISQVTKLLMAYCKFKNKEMEAVALREFMAFLNSKPKAIIKAEIFTNPEDNTDVKKNMVGEFVN